MNKIIYSIFIISICLFISGCQSSKENLQESNMSKEVSYDFYSFLKSPTSTEKQDLSHVIKLVVNKNEHSQDETLVFDVENKEVLIDPWMSSRGINSQGEILFIDDMGHVLNILESYNVLDWKEDYSTEDPKSYQDGVGWNVWLQYKDGTVESHKGSGSGLESITPEGFDEFFNELQTFVDERLEDGE